MIKKLSTSDGGWLSGLNNHFIIYFLAFSFVPLVIFSFFGYFLNKGLIRQVHEENLLEMARLKSSQIEFYLFEKRVILDNWYQINTDIDQQVEIPGLYGFHTLLKKKDGKFTAVRTGDMFDPAWLMLLNELPKTGYLLTDEFAAIAFSMENHAEFVAIPDLQAWRKLLTDKATGVSVNMISSDSVFIQEQGGGIFSFFTDSSGPDTLKAYSTIVPDWQLEISKSTDEIYDELRSFLMEIIIANLFVGIMMFVFALLLSRKITGPLHSLISAVQNIKQGDLSQPIRVNTKNEIQTLAEEFERMRLRLQESYLTLESKIEERTHALQDAQFQISHQEKMASLGLMAAGVAHEIGNPLTSISSMAQLIKRKVDDQKFIEYLNTILTNIDRISKIVRELVDFARPSSYEAANISVNELIENAINIVKYDKRTKQIELRLDLSKELPQVFLVADQLLQVFINILINAVDALTDENELIVIRSYLKDENIFIEFEDSGVGIPEENQNKIFEPFFTTKKVGKGTGLGLSVSYGIIKNFGGSITAQSTPGKGSTFIIELPVENNKEPK